MESSLTASASWLARDLELLNDARGFRSLVERDDLQVGSRPMPDDPNLLFRWRLPLVRANSSTSIAKTRAGGFPRG